MKKIIIYLVLLVSVGGGAFGVWNIYQNKKTDLSPPESVTEVQVKEEGEKEVIVAPRPDFPEELKNDQDQDGLTNEEEKKIGTNALEADTDGDGLSDFEEIKNTKTNPLLLDSDNDGFPDYIEIMGGYNPNGPGKLQQ